MKKLTKSVLALSTIASVLATGVGEAGAQTKYTYYNTNISYNGKQLSTPAHIAAHDPFAGANSSETSFLPIFYLEAVLRDMGITPNWDGQTLDLTVPSNIKVNYPATPKSMTLGSGVMAIKINGKIVTYAPKIAYQDKGSTTLTTFVPVFYLEKAFGYIGIQTGWDGTGWTMNMQSGGETKLAAAVAFAQAVHLKADPSGTNPYSDVPASDWPYIHALTTNYTWNNPAVQNSAVSVGAPILKADSGSSFGANDPISVSDIDAAMEVFSGLTPGHESYLPNGSVTGFGDAIGLNKGISGAGNLSTGDFATILTNLAVIEKGFVDLGNNTYQLVYRPGPVKNYWQTSFPADTYAKDWASAISVVNQTKVTYFGNNSYQTQIPGYSDSQSADNTMALIGVYSPEQYSVDGGATWKSLSSSYESIDPNNGGQKDAPTSVLIKDTNVGGISVVFIYGGKLQSIAAGNLWFMDGQPYTSFQ